MSELPTSDLEVRAAEERRQLRTSLDELKESVHDKLDPVENIRRHGLLLSGIAAILAGTLGYNVAGLFTGKPGR